MAASPPNPTLEDTQPGERTELAALFRRLAPEAPPLAGTHVEMLGFDEPGEPAAAVEIVIPAADEFAALVGETRSNGAQPGVSLDQTEAKAAAAPPDSPASPPPEADTPAAALTVDPDGTQRLRHNRRLDRRVRLPAELEIAGVPCTLIDVSVSGFAATGVLALEPYAVVPVTIRLVIDGIEVGAQLNARVVYVTKGRISGRFVDLTPSQTAFLRYIVTWRGESISGAATTTLLDAITGGSAPEPANGKADPPSRDRWWVGLIGRKVNPPR